MIGLAWPVSGAAEAELPFRFTNGFIWVEVQPAHTGTTLNFLFDSGAAVSTLSAAAAEEMNLRAGARVTVKGVSGATHGYWPQPLQASAHGVRLPRNFLVVDLCELERSCKCPVDGLIGADFFDGKKVQVDFGERKIRFLKSSLAGAGATTVPLRQRRGIWRVPVRINGGADQWLRLDTGCATGLHWVNSAAHGRSESSRLTVALTELALPTTRTRVAIGMKMFPDVPTTLHRAEIFAGEDGLLGNGILSRFDRVTIDTKAGLLILE